MKVKYKGTCHLYVSECPGFQAVDVNQRGMGK